MRIKSSFVWSRLSGEWAKCTGQITIELVKSKVPSSSATSVGAEELGTTDMAHSTYQSVVNEQTGPKKKTASL